MLVEHTNPCSLGIGNLYLIPGWNQIDDARWDALVTSKKWGKAIKGYIKEEVINLKDNREKLTIAIVEKTFDPNLLSSWSADEKNKGPLRGAIRKQIAGLAAEDHI